MGKSVSDIMANFKKAREKKKNRSLNSRILVIDGLNTFIRAFAVNPTRNPNGIHVGGITGCLLSIGTAVRKFDPTRCVVVFDGKGGSQRRRGVFEGYKEGRKTKDKSYNRHYDFDEEDQEKMMQRQIQRTIQYLRCFPVNNASIDFIEADDVIAYTCMQLFGPESEKIVMSSDKDFLQLCEAGANTKVWSPTKKKVYDRDAVEKEYGIPPRNFTIWRIIDGDRSDSIPGVNHVGPKRVQKFLGEFLMREEPQNPGDLLEYCKARTSESATYQRLVDNADILERNWRLMQLRNVDISAESKIKIQNLVKRTKPNELDREQALLYFKQDQLQQAFSNFPSWVRRTWSGLENARIKDTK